MNAEIEEYFYLLREVCRADDSSLGTAYRQLRELLEHLCRTQMTDSSLQMTDLAARINFVSSKLGLTVAEQNRLHTFRLASNAVLNRQAEPSREKLLRDAKTVSFFVKRITGEDTGWLRLPPFLRLQLFVLTGRYLRITITNQIVRPENR